MSLDKQNIGSKLYRVPGSGLFGVGSLSNRVGSSLLKLIYFDYYDTGFVDVVNSPEFIVWVYTEIDGKLTVEDTRTESSEILGEEVSFSYDKLTGHVMREDINY